ncbi:MAG: type VI secretion system baseplate subunit TssK [Chitinispirillaceae bacterium]|nr:type VI secretion system baseplate subunit TssK [Chitinispirillaceae bacterium]
MSKRKRVLWKEGMFLQPQHFQLADSFFEKTITARWSFQNPFFFGVADSAVDSTALANGVFTLTSCSGIMPDGTVFSIPREDDPPPSRSFADHFSHEQQSCDVFLALPLALEGRPSAGTASEGAAGQCRYKLQSGTVVDEVTGTQKKQIEAGAYNFTVLFGGESLDNYSSMPIARLKRSPNGQIELQEDYIPPLVQVGGSQYLMGQLRSLLELLLAKSSSLSQGRKEGAGGKATFSSGEETAFRLLGAVNTYTPLLNHYHFEPRLPPFELFRLLTQLAGALTVFSADVSLKDLTRYDHGNLCGTFGGLMKLIRSVLEAEIDAGCMVIPLEQVNPATYVCKLPNEKLMAVARFYLGVSAKVPEKELIIGVAQRIKMSSRDRLDVLISSAMPGLPLIHVARPSEELSTKPGFLYFALDQQSQFWRGMQSAGSIALYFPNNYPELKLEMLALKQ